MNKTGDTQDEDIVFEDEEDTEVSGFKGKSEQKLRAELKACLKEKQEYLEGWQRAKADLVNYKREAEKSRQGFAKFATEDLILQILPVLDSFDVALKHTDDSGVEQIYRQLLSVLKANRVEQIDPAGEAFDPVQHDSVGVVKAKNKNEDGTIVETVQKGYTLAGKLIRPAKVTVGEYKN